MSDSGYPQSEHSGSVTSRNGYINETRPRSHPYNNSAPRQSVGMNPDHSQNEYFSTHNNRTPPAIPPQKNVTNNGYYQDNASVMVIHSETESDKEYRDVHWESPHGGAAFAQMRSAMYKGSSSAEGPRVPAKSGVLPVGYGGWFPGDRVTVARPAILGHQVDKLGEAARKKAQIQAYIAWVNVQLKKKAGTRMIEDLMSDLHDGVALADLIEIVAGDCLPGIHSVPSSKEQMVENVDKVIEFMQTRRIRMHHTTAIDIVEGNTKSIMRLILALAAHFKPNSVKQSSHTKVHRGDTMAGIAQGAAAALADARRDVSVTMSRPSRPKHLTQQDRRRSSGSDSEQPIKAKSSSPSQNSYQSSSSSAVMIDGSSASHSPRPTVYHASPRAHNGLRHSPRVLGTASPRVGTGTGGVVTASTTPGRSVPKSQSMDLCQQTVVQEVSETSQDVGFVRQLSSDHTELANEVLSAKHTLMALQDLLLNGRVPDGEESPAMKIEATNSGEEVVILRSKLQQSDILVKELQDDLSSVRQECLELQGAKMEVYSIREVRQLQSYGNEHAFLDERRTPTVILPLVRVLDLISVDKYTGVQQRLSEQEHSFLVMKADLVRAGFRMQTLETSKAEVEKKLLEKDKVVLDLRRELAKREREIDELKANFQVEQQQRDATARNLRSQIQDLHGKLQHVGETEASLSARVSSQDRKMARLEGKLLQQTQQYETGSTSSHRPSSGRSTHSASSDDMQMVKDSLHTLRTSFHGNDSQHHVIDQLECSISVLMDRLRLSETGSGAGSDGGRRGNFDSTGDARRSPITAIHGFQSHRLEHTSNGNFATKVLYFTERTVTPFMCSIPKRLGEIKLRDVKTVIDRPGNYRYHFKAMDPEFGTVKEEILQDEQIIPGWEGKIVAWVEEDHG